MSSETTNFGLCKPDAGAVNWAEEINDNWDKIDLVLAHARVSYDYGPMLSFFMGSE